MNQSLWQKLKRVKIKDLFHIFLCIIAIPCALVYKIFHKNLWILCDSAGEARDNAYWLFKYITEEHPEEDVIFAIDKKSCDFEKVQKCGKTVQFGSLLHWIMYLSSKYVISSQKASGPNAAVCYILERFRLFRGNKIFLQHGIIKDDISFLYYQYTKIRLFTCSVKRELDYVRERYGYPKENVQLLGLCRFDELLKDHHPEKTILIMPTWRKWLSHPTEGTSFKQLEEIFLQSEYYKRWSALLKHQDFQNLIEKNDWKVIFYLHREAQKYSGFFKSENPRIQIGRFPEDDVQILLKKSGILVTDYSSVAMDFALLDKPVCYFQFDYEKFRSGHLGEGYFDYERDGFGPVCQYEADVLSALEEYVVDIQRNDAIYQKRRDEFFTLKDQNNCQRTYKAIQAIK